MTQPTLSDPPIELLRVGDSDETMAGSLQYLTFPDGVRFDLYIDQHEQDEISIIIREKRYGFPSAFSLLMELTPPGGRVLDLGAHIGTFSLNAAAHGYAVRAVEASPRNTTLLSASIARNGYDQFGLTCAAISDRSGTLEFLQGGPYGRVAKPDHANTAISVPAIRVDELLRNIGWDHVDFIKLDIEGWEPAALRGMQSLLARADAPPIVYESNAVTLRNFGKGPQDIAGPLEFFGYRRFLIDGHTLFPFQPGELQPECTVDFLAIKHMPESLNGWIVRSPVTTEEKAAQIMETCAAADAYQRAYMGRALAGYGELIASDLRIATALNTLTEDADESVRDAVSWWRQTSTSIEIVRLRQALAEIEALVDHLAATVRGYESGRFIRTMRAIDQWRRRIRASG